MELEHPFTITMKIIIWHAEVSLVFSWINILPVNMFFKKKPKHNTHTHTPPNKTKIVRLSYLPAVNYIYCGWLQKAEVRFGSTGGWFSWKSRTTTHSGSALHKWLWCVKGESDRKMKVHAHNSDSHGVWKICYEMNERAVHTWSLKEASKCNTVGRGTHWEI